MLPIRRTISVHARVAAAALTVLSASGCAVFGNKTLQKDPSFRAGYQDGCAAATNQGSDLRDRPVGDKQLYANDDTYRKGWGSGFQVCRRSDVQPNAAPGDNPISLPGPGH